MTLSPAHVLVLRWLMAHPGQSAEEIAVALSYPDDADEITRLCRDLEARGLITLVSRWPRGTDSARRPSLRPVARRLGGGAVALRTPSRA